MAALSPGILPVELGGTCTVEELAMDASMAALEEQEAEVTKATDHLLALAANKLKANKS